MYFVDVKNDNSVKVLIRREIHLVNNLKINMFIDNDVIVSEDVVLDLIKKQTFIDSCDVTIVFDVRSRVNHAQQRSIHVKKTIVLSSRNQMTIFIHHFVDELLVNRDFLFESDESNFILYVHIVDVDIKVVLIINDSNHVVKISRNFRLDKLIEFDFSQIYHLNEDENVVELIKRKSKFEHKTSWFKKFITIIVIVNVIVTVVINIALSKTSIDFILSKNKLNAIAYIVESFISELQKSFLVFVSELRKLFSIQTIKISFITIDAIDFDEKSFANNFSEIIFFNDVTIHQSNVIQFFVNIVDEFSTLWKNIDFVELPQDNWMRIFLKFDWESRINSKIKIYSFDQRDRNLVDKTFDEFHEQNRLSWIIDSTSFNYSTFVVWKNVDDEKKNKIMINIRELNAITQSDVYFLSLQIDIISIVRNCSFISIVDASVFFINDAYIRTIDTNSLSLRIVIKSFSTWSLWITKIHRFTCNDK